MIAALNGNKEVVEALIEAKANVDVTDNVRGVGRGGEEGGGSSAARARRAQCDTHARRRT